VSECFRRKEKRPVFSIDGSIELSSGNHVILTIRKIHQMIKLSRLLFVAVALAA
jgi:hypothetical protein